MLALAALIGADARVPTMVLQRAPLGQRGSYLATVLNIAQCLGWAIFELIVIATAARAALRQALRVRGGLGVEAPLRRARRGARADRADRVRPPLRAQVRDLGGRGLGRLPRLVDPRRRRSRRLWSHPGRAPRLLLARGRHGDRGHGLVGAARRRLHAVLARPAQRVLRRRASATCSRRCSSSASARSSSSRAASTRTTRS